MITKFKTLTAYIAFFVGSITTLLATVPEPSTILYGQVIHRAYGNDYQLTEGVLEWTLRNQDDELFVYTCELEDLKEVFSYRIGIPHQALSSGLTVDADVIPLASGEDTYEFESITVDGYEAAILWSDVDYLELLQNSRAATHRIDLLVSFDLLDTDGDGMPDWWEKFHGLDWQLDDSNLDPDGDGWNNLEEYRRGTNPFFDDRVPTIQGLNLAAYGASNNGVWLRGVDADTLNSALEYTVTSLPQGGYLHYIQATESVSGELPLSVGSTFTQEDLNQGRLAYRHTDPQVTETTFTIILSDGVNESVSAVVEIDVFPSSTLEDLNDETIAMPFWWRDENTIFEAYFGLRQNVLNGDLVESSLLYLLGKDYGWTLWDQRAASLPVTLHTSGIGSHFILGGSGDDELQGGPAGDILRGGDGTDTLLGGEGADLFVVSDLGDEIIGDFNVLDDILDVDDLLDDQSGALNDFLQVSFDGSDSIIGVDQDGGASDYSDASIILIGIEVTQADLHRLWSEGQLLTGAVQGYVTVSFQDWPTSELEEGYDIADLTLLRNGPTNLPLTVQISLTGSAVNGVDYQVLFGSVTFNSGESTTTIQVEPLSDGALEGTEQVNVALLAGSGYVLGALDSGQISIVDAKQRFFIQAVEALAAVNGDPGLFLITRQGPINTATTLFLDVDGSGVKDQDYVAIPTYVSFAAYQTDYVIPVIALDGGALTETDTSRTVTVGLKPSYSNSYLLGSSTEDMVRLLSSAEAFEAWVLANNDNADAGMTTDELIDVKSSRTGIQSLLEYAMSYGVDFDDGLNVQEQVQFSPQLITEDSDNYVEFTQRLNDPRLEYTLEVSKDLQNWNSGADYLEAISLSEAQENAGRVRYRILNNDGQNCFVRVVVNLND